MNLSLSSFRARLLSARMMSPTETNAQPEQRQGGKEEGGAKEEEEEVAPMEVDQTDAAPAPAAPVENGEASSPLPPEEENPVEEAEVSAPEMSPPVSSQGKEEEEEKEENKESGKKEENASPTHSNADADAPASSDVEKFGGKIVYNPDGSAYIIEEGELSDDDSQLLPLLPRLEGSIVERPGEEATDEEEYPQIANAFYISKGGAGAGAAYYDTLAKLMAEKKVPPPETTPVVHSYRVFSARDRSGEGKRPEAADGGKNPLVELSTVPVKPILMCFACKLSFGCGQTFESHCVDSHGLRLSEEEKGLLRSKNGSAIVQNVGKEKETIVSFLEPFTSSGGETPAPPPSSSSAAALAAVAAAAAAAANGKAGNSGGSPPRISPGAINHLLSAAAAAAASLPKVPSSIPPPSSSPSPTEPQLLRRSPLSATLSPAGLSNPRRSPGAVSPSNNANSSPSPVSLPPPSSYSSTVPTNANMLQGTTIGACPEHVNGRPTGVECSKCDLILNQSRLGGLGWNVSRNSCKTLKCPKCNWHYKYQETLEIHMKEKHPENETTCIYCITGQQHPRLARGETYTCGYKPYRCEVCNYSTTTKGNLSIHMQSDKHLNNMQDLQNGGLIPPTTTSGEAPKLPPPPTASRPLPPSSQSPLPSPSKQQKPNWRCDVCNYETNVARNLRIHMTSEKHTHNIMSMQQQGAKAMQQLMSGSPGASGTGPTGFPRLPPPPGLDPKNLLGLFAGGGLNPPTSGAASEQAAMADLAYNQALLAQMMSGGQFPGGPPPAPFLPPTSGAGGAPDLAAIFAGAAAAAAAAGMRNDGPSEPPPEAVDPNPKSLFSCCVCRAYGCDTLDELSHHLSQDRSRTRENEVSIVIAGNYLCQLCNYKTNLKANFQLHCKTDKHLQRLSHVNHIKEGGPANEWKLRFLTSMNSVELRCNACDFVTNSPHKMQVHFSNQQHQVSALLFSHLKKEELHKGGDKLSYNCSLCQFSAPGKHLLMGHVRSMKHLQMEQMHQLKKRAEGNLAQTEIGDIFQVVDNGANGKDYKEVLTLCIVFQLK